MHQSNVVCRGVTRALAQRLAVMLAVTSGTPHALSPSASVPSHKQQPSDSWQKHPLRQNTNARTDKIDNRHLQRKKNVLPSQSSGILSLGFDTIVISLITIRFQYFYLVNTIKVTHCHFHVLPQKKLCYAVSVKIAYYPVKRKPIP